jgi:glycosyltransferase involved in cell wall biosynthesis
VRTLSDPMRDFLVAKGVPAERVIVLPVGAEPSAEKWTPRENPRHVLYLGGAADYQGLDALLEAMRILAREAPDVRLTVVGPEAVPGAPGNVEFPGRVSHDRVASFYLSHDLFVLPRPRTPLTELVVPMKLPEAMSFGIPILATDLGAARWAVGKGGAMLVADNRPETLAAGIRAALADPAALLAWSEHGRARSAAFTWNAIARSVVRELFDNRKVIS